MIARETALKALGAYRRDKLWPKDYFSGLADNSTVHPSETALAMQIAKGVLQNMTLIDYCIAQFSSIALKKLEPRVHDILRMSVYQLAFLTRIPPSAAVNEGVALAKKYSNPKAAGFVNAVLRKAATASENGSLMKIEAETEQRRLSIEYSHPEWFVREVFSILGFEGAEAFLKANNASDTPITAQINTLRSNIDDALNIMRADGAQVSPHIWLENCAELFNTGRIANMEAYKKGLFYVQDAAARLAVAAASPKPGDFVIDGCAAPGGKSFAAAIAMENTGRVISFDITDTKLSRIRDGARRLGLCNIETLKSDASVRDENFFTCADIVFADVPCSGFGVIRKNPEIRYKTEKDIEGLPYLQESILSNLSGYVQPEGTLIYSTCTILKRENEDVVESFLSSHKEFCLEEFNLPAFGRVKGGMITLWPHKHGTDGFFICRLKRLGIGMSADGGLRVRK